MVDLEETIDEKIGEVRLDSLDFSFGELMSLYSTDEFTISPDFQRYFRWSNGQRSRLIESILLELPIPQIFVIENQDGVYELIDGLQRISSVVNFVQHDLLNLEEPLRLEGCDLIPSLNGILFADLPLALRLRIKRSKVRTVVIKRQSSRLLRYEMFKRLNTGGSALSEQEIRNCTARMVGKRGSTFYEFLRNRAATDAFQICTSTLPDAVRDKRGDEELILRFLALKCGKELFRGNVRDWLDGFMEEVILGKRPFNYTKEAEVFNRLFEYLKDVMGEGAFVRYRNGSPIGGLAPAYFEAVTLGVQNVFNELQGVGRKDVRSKLIETVESTEFRQFVGSGSNALHKFNGRINSIESALRGLLP